ncbi:hypothetical protein KC19_4G026700 [Ceratodon purpureus]|uniref:Cytochrome P450 n=1 Tax=Ceratodon purpureus TaxID=3225 RepID=A0A8T0I7M5_CERPU|nr:hypothetical protein KC19_4G026700 [Ceratodon purpureus]
MSDLGSGCSSGAETHVIGCLRGIWSDLCERYGYVTLITLVSVLLAVITLSAQKHARTQKLNLPPGPRPWPIIGSLHLLGTLPHKCLTDLARNYGPVMSVQLGQRLCIVATSLEAAMEFLKHQGANFSSRPYLRSAKLIMPNDISFQPMTPIQRHLKKIVVTELTSAKRLEASKDIRRQEAEYMIRTISQETGPIKLSTCLNVMTTNILTRLLLDKRFMRTAGDQNVSEIMEFVEIVKETMQCYGAIHLQDVFNYIPQWFDPSGWDTRSRKLGARLESFHTKMVNEHREKRRRSAVSEGEKNMLDVLLEELEKPEHGVTEEYIKGAVWNTLLAGTDTSSVTSEWAMAEVLKNPTLMENARSELDRVVGKNRIVQESDIPNLAYIQAILKETLRLHAPVSMLLPHESINATKAFGYEIPANTWLIVNFWGMARDPTIWDNPMEFKPERFLEGGPNEQTDFRGQHFEFIPFGSGRRICPGMTFGWITVNLEVANLLHAFDWSLPHGMAPEDLDMSEGPGIVVSMLDPLVAIAKPRLPSHLYQV